MASIAIKLKMIFEKAIKAVMEISMGSAKLVMLIIQLMLIMIYSIKLLKFLRKLIMQKRRLKYRFLH
jgi:hypothetical protein